LTENNVGLTKSRVCHCGRRTSKTLIFFVRIWRATTARCFCKPHRFSLPRFWHDQGKREEPRKLLAAVYGWFTEGFDTRDLKEAKTLLDELTA
jgi:hypothetical protein